MISISHWGMFRITGDEQTIPQLFADALYSGFIKCYDAEYIHRPIR